MTWPLRNGSFLRQHCVYFEGYLKNERRCRTNFCCNDNWKWFKAITALYIWGLKILPQSDQDQSNWVNGSFPVSRWFFIQSSFPTVPDESNMVICFALSQWSPTDVILIIIMLMIRYFTTFIVSKDEGLALLVCLWQPSSTCLSWFVFKLFLQLLFK